MPGSDELYTQARCLLLDGLEALAPHHEHLTLIGAQAIYLRVGEADIAVAPSTSDGDLALDPNVSGEGPPLEQLMRNAGFELARDAGGAALVGLWTKPGKLIKGTRVTIDLLMPESATAAIGRRAARLEGHQVGSVMRVSGLEAALVDHDVMTVRSLESEDARSFDLQVAGAAALLVAKTHKIQDRSAQGGPRLKDKDALDVYRLLVGTPTDELVVRMLRVRADERASLSVLTALESFRSLFGARTGEGVMMAQRATAGLVAPEDISAALTTLSNDLIKAVMP
jgi:hypothetical protein